MIEPMNILYIITALLTETKIILISKYPSLFFNICEILLSLIYPFEWIHFYRPFIPPSDPYINYYLYKNEPALFGLLSSCISILNDKNNIIHNINSNQNHSNLDHSNNS